jgi:hypothetical protein
MLKQESFQMAKCSQCGEEVSPWSRDVFTHACPKCRAAGMRPGSLGCGTLIVIALIVLFFSHPGIQDVDSKVSRLQTAVKELKDASDQQAKELRELRKFIEDSRKGAAGNDK